MPSYRWLANPDILRRLLECPPEVRHEFFRMHQELVEDPRSPWLGVARLQDRRWPDAWSVSFAGDGLLVYRIFEDDDEGVIEPLHLHLLSQ